MMFILISLFPSSSVPTYTMMFYFLDFIWVGPFVVKFPFYRNFIGGIMDRMCSVVVFFDFIELNLFDI